MGKSIGKATRKDLSGHRALITGASSGLGEQYARQLAARGVDLVIAARREERLEKLASELSKAHGVKVETFRSDLSRAEAPAELFRQATKSGSVTILVNNAGIGPYAPFVSEAAEKHVGTVQLNVTSLTELTHLFTAHMIAHGKPSFIQNVGSVASFQGAPNFAVYSATKHYVRVLSEVLARELNGTNVTVSCLCPGGTHTEFSDVNGQVLKKGSDAFMMSAEEVVRIGLSGLFGRRAIVVPGFINKVASIIPRFLPSSVALALSAKAMDRNVERKR